jgi:hypothetical protein
LKKFILLAILILGSFSTTLAQTTGNGAGKAWVVLDSQYNTSPFNDTTKVDVYFDGSDYIGHITSVQFRIGYDGNAFVGVNDVQNRLGANYIVSYNDNTTANQVLISIVYTGQSATASFSQGSMVTIRFQNIHPYLLYSNEQNITPFNFSAYIPIGSNSAGADVTIGDQNHGGAVKIPHRRYTGFVRDYATNKGIPNLEYQLIKNAGQGIAGTIPTVLGGAVTRTNAAGYYEMVYYENFYGYYQPGITTYSFLFKTEELDSDPALTTADAFTQLLFANQKTQYNPIKRLVSDVNHSHTSTIADAYTLYAYFATRFINWSTLGQGGYRDVMIIRPEDVKFLKGDSLTTTALGVGPLGFEPQKTNWTYNLSAYNGQNDMDETFYVAIMGDINGTSLGGVLTQGAPAPRQLASIDTTVNRDSIVFAEIPEVLGKVGEFVNVPLLMRTQQMSITSFNFRLNYDPSVLRLVEATSPALTNSWMLYFNADSLDYIDYGGIDGSAGTFPIRFADPSPIINFKFEILRNIDATPLTFGTKNSAGGMMGEDLLVEVKNGVLTTTTIIPDINNPTIPTKTELGNAYPNPFNPTTIIPLSMSKSEMVKLEVYDVSGRLVETLYDGVLSLGEHRFSFTANGLSSGLYIYRLTSSDNVVTKKIVLIK